MQGKVMICQKAPKLQFLKLCTAAGVAAILLLVLVMKIMILMIAMMILLL
jgi:hypothetical protein